jgi:tRNA 5-methylaminomethyl-2-thiouridine biosynthesis bifunctional protein
VITLPTARWGDAPQGASSPPRPTIEAAFAQARQVFIAGNALPERWAGRRSFVVLETGFGIGLNFLTAWDAWRSDPGRPSRLHFVSVEHAPLEAAGIVDAAAGIAELAPLARALANVLPPPLAGFHRMHFDGGRVILTMLFGAAADVLPQLDARVDAFMLDGFTPSRDPQAWSPAVVRELARLAAQGATLATRTVATGIQAALRGAGFTIEARGGGDGTTHEMLAGRREGAGSDRAPASRAMVIGGGLAGTLVAERLASRDCDVTLIDARERSFAAVGLVRPVVNLRDALNAQASRSAHLYALQHFRALAHDGFHLQWDRSGILQLAGDAEEEARMAAIAAAHGYPESFLRYVDAHAARAIARREVRAGGWHLGSGAWVSPESLAIASLARAGERVRRHMGRAVERVSHEEGEWIAWDESGNAIARAPHVVVANAAGAARLLPQARLTLSRVRGQVTYLPPSPSRALPLPVSGSGYVAPLPEGAGWVVGASFQHDDEETRVRLEDHGENLARAESMLPGFAADADPTSVRGWAGFRTTVPDRLPVFGATAQPNAWLATGLGSRGLLWGPLGAELIASAISGEPCPLPRDLAGSISPLRFLS